jgi:hypothetical protein
LGKLEDARADLRRAGQLGYPVPAELVTGLEEEIRAARH